MGYWTDRREEVGMMPYNVSAKALGIETKERLETYLSEVTKYSLGIAEEVDDVEYNQKWWKWYCQENKLDVVTGKSLRGSSYFRIDNSLLF